MKRKSTKGVDEAGVEEKKEKCPSQVSTDAIDSIFSKKKKLCSEEKNAKQKKEISKRKTGRPALVRPFSSSGKEWVDDGLGGRFNHEGFTGRVEDGVKVFKAHVLNRPTAGKTKDCPFDCQCCFI
jgi:hypothetical protein